jgi:WD40 repeat protein
VLILEGETAAHQVAFTPDGARLIVWRHERTLEVWELPAGKLVRSVGPFNGAHNDTGFALHPSGQVAFVADHGIGIATLGDPPAVTRIEPGVIGRVLASPNGEWVVASGRSGGEERLWGFRCSEAGELLPAWEVAPHAELESVGAFVRDRLVTINWKRLTVRSVATGGEVLNVPHPAKFGARLLASPDGSRLAGMSDTRMYVWDTATWARPARVTAPRGVSFRSFALHPTRSLLAAIQVHQSLVTFFDVTAGKPAAKFQWKLGEMKSVAFSADGSLAAAGSASGKVVVWDVDE